MGLNYYMRLREPERGTVPLAEVAGREWDGRLADPRQPVEIADRHEVHIAKLSWGRVPCFEATPRRAPGGGGDARYAIESVGDIRRYMATGDYEIVDEDGAVLSWDDFEREVLGWERRMREDGYEGEVLDEAGYQPALRPYVDPEGYRFCRVRFS